MEPATVRPWPTLTRCVFVFIGVSALILAALTRWGTLGRLTDLQLVSSPLQREERSASNTRAEGPQEPVQKRADGVPEPSSKRADGVQESSQERAVSAPNRSREPAVQVAGHAAGVCSARAQTVICSRNSSLEAGARYLGKSLQQLLAADSGFWRGGYRKNAPLHENLSVSEFLADLLNWTRGCMLWHKSSYDGCGCAASSAIPPPATCATCLREAKGAWNVSSRGFTPNAGCACPNMEWSRCDVLNMLQGWHIGIMGDSMARQIFQAFLAILRFGHRGPSVDHYFHDDATFWATATEDCLEVKGLERCPPMPAAPGLKISFLWNPFSLRDHFQHHAKAAQRLGITALVLMSGYWFPKNTLGNLQETISNMSEGSVGIPTFVHTIPYYHSGNFTAVSAALRSKVARTPGVILIDFEVLASLAERRALEWRNTEDKAHFGCGFEPMSVHRIPEIKQGPPTSIKAFKFALGRFDCNDTVDLHLVRAIVTSLIHVRRGSLGTPPRRVGMTTSASGTRSL